MSEDTRITDNEGYGPFNWFVKGTIPNLVVSVDTNNPRLLIGMYILTSEGQSIYPSVESWRMPIQRKFKAGGSGGRIESDGLPDRERGSYIMTFKITCSTESVVAGTEFVKLQGVRKVDPITFSYSYAINPSTLRVNGGFANTTLPNYSTLGTRYLYQEIQSLKPFELKPSGNNKLDYYWHIDEIYNQVAEGCLSNLFLRLSWVPQWANVSDIYS
jgi:hypothetical protein